MKKLFTLLFTIFSTINGFTSPPIEEVGFTERLRTQALSHFDKILSWTFHQQRYSFILQSPINTETFQVQDKEIHDFITNHGFFSENRPLVSKVTKSQGDILITLQLLRDVHESIFNDTQREIMVNEILSKVVAYRDLNLLQELPIPCFSERLVTYSVDEILDLGNGMPAYGLISKESGFPPILLFRGTDLSFLSERGLASMVSDLDPKGPGLSVFLHSRAQIHEWLSKQSSKAKIIGCSLGGALAIYTYLHEYPLIDQVAAFNPPGISKKMFSLWNQLPPEKQIPLKVYVTKGDLIPKIGKLVGDVYELAATRTLYPIAAHATLITAEPTYTQNKINLKLENESERFLR